jgi:hypothetical protein
LLVLEEWFTFLKSVIILLWYIRSLIPLTGNVSLRNLQSKRAITALE